MSRSIPPNHSFGRGLSESCLTWHNTIDDPCTLQNFGGKKTLVDATEAYKTINNESSINQLITLSFTNDSINFSSVKQPLPVNEFSNTIGSTFVLLSDARISDDVDFRASTIAINTQCTPITRACNLTTMNLRDGEFGIVSNFNCSNFFYGSLENLLNSTSTAPWAAPQGWGMLFFNDSNMLAFASAQNPTNPIYFAMTAILQSNSGNSYPLYDDEEIIHPSGGGDAFILLCNATVYDAIYSWIDGAVTEALFSPSNVSLANIVNAPQREVTGSNRFGIAHFVNGAIVAGFSNTSQALADRLGLVYSQTALGLAAGAFSVRLNLEEQTRQSLLVTKLQYAPLYTLIALNIIYATFGIGLAVAGICASLKREGLREAQVWLSFWGIGAYGFEEPNTRKVQGFEDLFHECKEKRQESWALVGLEKINGVNSGLRYQIWNTKQSNEL